MVDFAEPPRGGASSPARDGESVGAFGSAAGTGTAQPRRRCPPGAANVYAALDLGTNNCRLLVARPEERDFRVIDAFSRIVRLGEGLAGSGRLAEPAVRRAIEALKICRDKLDARRVTRARLIATEAVRSAANGACFVARVLDEVGLELDVIDRATEARLAAAGCLPLVDPASDGVVLFDIGGGSSELVWVDAPDGRDGGPAIRSWASFPVGVVTLAERYGGVDVTAETFEAMVREIAALARSIPAREEMRRALSGLHMLGTSGTVTTIAGVFLNLPRYDRRKVDGLWLTGDQVGSVVRYLRNLSFAQRVANPCIGPERADLVLAGCAILEGIRREFPCRRLRVADRGLREGILVELMRADGVWRTAERS